MTLLQSNTSQVNSLLKQLIFKNVQACDALDAIIARLSIPPYLKPHTSTLTKWVTPWSLYCDIRAPHWETDALLKMTDGRLVFPNPEQHYSIYLRLNVLKGGRMVCLEPHYSTSPTWSEYELSSRCDNAALTRYYSRRSEFFREFMRGLSVPDFSFFPGIDTLGGISYELGDKTEAELIDWLQSTISGIAQGVDQTLIRMEKRRSEPKAQA